MNELIKLLEKLLKEIFQSIKKNQGFKKYIDDLLGVLIKLREFKIDELPPSYQKSREVLIKKLTQLINTFTQKVTDDLDGATLHFGQLLQEIEQTNLNDTWIIMPSLPKQKENKSSDYDSQTGNHDGDSSGDGEQVTKKIPPKYKLSTP